MSLRRTRSARAPRDARSHPDRDDSNFLAETRRRWSALACRSTSDSERGLAALTLDTSGSPARISSAVTRSEQHLPNNSNNNNNYSQHTPRKMPNPPHTDTDTINIHNINSNSSNNSHEPFASPTPRTPASRRHPLSDTCCSPQMHQSSSSLDQQSGHVLHHSELAALKQRFRELDASGRGFLSRSEFYQLFRSIVELPVGVDSSLESPLFDFAYNLFDSGGGEGLDMKEFISGCWILVGSEEQRVRHLFDMYDKDNSGSLNIAELQQVFRVMRSFAIAKEGSEAAGCQSIGLPLHRRCGSENMLELAERALKQHDNDCDGSIGFEDFQRWCASNPIVKGWTDMLSKDTARGIARIRDEQERLLLVKELNDIGLMDAKYWQKTLNISMVTPEVRSSAYSPHPSSVPGEPAINGEFRLGAPVAGPSHSGTTADNNTDPEISSSIASSKSALTIQESAIGRFAIDFNGLTFERRIGEGSFAEVFAGRWLDSAVAIKVFKSGPRLIMNSDGTATVVATNEGGETLDGISFDPALQNTFDQEDMGVRSESEDEAVEEHVGRERFLQEVSLLMSLRHPHILFYIGVTISSGLPLCIVSELIDGKSLFSLLHGRGNGRLNMKEKLKLTQDIARGMLYLHSRSPPVLHRDLKSANILVEKHAEMKATIIDFGLSKLSSTTGVSRSNANGLCGSLITMAPEIMERKQYTPGADVYSFGVIAWEIFSHRIPYRNMNPAQVIHQTMSQKRPQFRKKDRVPDGIRHLIERCWAHDIEERPDFMLVVRELIKLKPRVLAGYETDDKNV